MIKPTEAIIRAVRKINMRCMENPFIIIGMYSYRISPFINIGKSRTQCFLSAETKTMIINQEMKQAGLYTDGIIIFYLIAVSGV